VGIASNLDEALSLQAMIGTIRQDLQGSDTLPRLWGTVGVHPHEAASAPAELGHRISEILESHPEIVAIGECGLDFHYDFSPQDVQRRVFRAQIEVAASHMLPLVVHCRNAEVEMASWIREAGEGGVRGVLHCFPGDETLLGVALEAGWLVSFTGMVTFSSFNGEVAVRTVPANRYMLETDGPYLAPVPLRGKRNESAFLTFTRDRIAELRGTSPEQVEAETSENARRFFSLDLPSPS
jgi:TatD DNase family protein